MEIYILSQYVSDAPATADIFQQELERRMNNKPLTADFQWRQRNGELISISKMTKKHILNTMKMLSTCWDNYLQEEIEEDLKWED